MAPLAAWAACPVHHPELEALLLPVAACVALLLLPPALRWPGFLWTLVASADPEDTHQDS